MTYRPTNVSARLRRETSAASPQPIVRAPTPANSSSPQAVNSSFPHSKVHHELLSTGRQSKQKACLACVKAKRCCDRTLPSCSRCLDKEVDCVYQRRLQPGRTGFDTALDLVYRDPLASSTKLVDQGNIPGVQAGAEAHINSVLLLPCTHLGHFWATFVMIIRTVVSGTMFLAFDMILDLRKAFHSNPASFSASFPPTPTVIANHTDLIWWGILFPYISRQLKARVSLIMEYVYKNNSPSSF